jgi:photosystem II stability/assembly factor-like uncharacterized protein
MNIKTFSAGGAAILMFTIGFFFTLNIERSVHRERKEEEGHALEAFANWYNQRALPFDTIPMQKYRDAVHYVNKRMLKERMLTSSPDTSQWVSLGPNNVGGRILSVAVDPESTDIVWVGAAGGGLWKSTTKGVGASAWKYVNTGLPSLAVSSIAIHTAEPTIMYIGTGEIGSIYGRAQVGTPGARSTYGMGVLKSTDRGQTWTQTSLIWDFSEITAVQKVVINPLNPHTVFAATTEGTYKTTDGGDSWSFVQSVLMAMDIVINPTDTSVLYAAYGQRNSTPNAGLYKTTDAGATWTLQSGALPTSNFGRTSLAISPSDPAIVYASVAHASSSQLYGLYRTTNNGTTWTLQNNTTNYLGGQGWYDNVIAVHPTNPDIVLCAGLDIYKSTNGGTTLTQKSYWYVGYGGVIFPGEDEGPAQYAHADHHAIVFDPTNPSTIYFGTDGGMFASTDGGEFFDGRNGGFATTQFYNGFANAESDSLVALGGLQDNGTLKYEGTTAWNKVYGGDGGWCAIDPVNKNILYEEYIYLAMSKSTDGGYNWFSITNGLATGSSNANFIAPFVISPSSPNVLYAGAKSVYKTTNGGAFWFPDSPEFNTVPIACIGVSYTSSDTLMAGTGSGAVGATPLFEIFASVNGGTNWSNVTGSLPSRYPTDISFDPTNSATAYLTYSGYGVPHVFKTTDVGQTWEDISSNLPDLPVQSIVADPAYPQSLYIGTDLGVFHTTNGGAEWFEYNLGMPQTMVTDITISKTNRVLRASTFGNGVYERKLREAPIFITMSVRDRWNLVSLPVTVDDPLKSSVFPTATSPAFEFNEGYIEQDTLENRKGYWLKFSGNQNVTFRGLELSVDTIDVHQGWNLIGSVSYSLNVLTIGSIPPEIQASDFFEYNDGYRYVDFIEPGKGYWVKVEQDGKFILSSSPGLKPNQRIKIVHTNELPPPPPEFANFLKPEKIILEQNYPNPFNTVTSIQYSVPISQYVSLKVYDISGKEVAILVEGFQMAGYHDANFDASHLASGVYLYKLTSGKHAFTKRMLLLK